MSMNTAAARARVPARERERHFLFPNTHDVFCFARAEPLSEMEFAKVHAKSDGLAEWVFNTCQSAHYRVFVPE